MCKGIEKKFWLALAVSRWRQSAGDRGAGGELGYLVWRFCRWAAWSDCWVGSWSQGDPDSGPPATPSGRSGTGDVSPADRRARQWNTSRSTGHSRLCLVLDNSISVSISIWWHNSLRLTSAQLLSLKISNLQKRNFQTRHTFQWVVTRDVNKWSISD